MNNKTKLRLFKTFCTNLEPFLTFVPCTSTPCFRDLIGPVYKLRGVNLKPGSGFDVYNAGTANISYACHKWHTTGYFQHTSEGYLKLKYSEITQNT